MPEFTPPPGATPIDRDKMLSLGFIRGGLPSRPRVREGREHPDTGRPWKAVTDELGNTQTEHAVKGDRLDARVHVKPIALRVGAPQTGG